MPQYRYTADVLNVVDADTLDLRVRLATQERFKEIRNYPEDPFVTHYDCGFRIYVPTTNPRGECGYFEDRFRLADIDAWETRGFERADGLSATQALQGLLDKYGWEGHTVETLKDRRGKYGRWLAVLYVGGVNVNEWLVKNGHAIRVNY